MRIQVSDLSLSYEKEQSDFLREIALLNDQYNGTDESALVLAYNIAHKYSTCRLCGVGKGVGAIISDGNRIVDFGYNGVSRYISQCTKTTCIRSVCNIPDHTNRDICYGDCAEKKAISNACRYGIKLVGAIAYLTKSPCISCTKLLIDVGIKKIVYHREYSQPEFSNKLMDMAGVKIYQCNSTILNKLVEL